MGSTTSTTTEPTARDRFWLDHDAALTASGQTSKEYAEAQGLSLQALYQSRKRLRSFGLLDPAPGRSKASSRRRPGQAVSFSKIAVASAPTDSRFCLELPGGMVLEWSGGDVPESVVSLLERLARPA